LRTVGGKMMITTSIMMGAAGNLNCPTGLEKTDDP
jgi:hypothetical protein